MLPRSFETVYAAPAVSLLVVTLLVLSVPSFGALSDRGLMAAAPGARAAGLLHPGVGPAASPSAREGGSAHVPVAAATADGHTAPRPAAIGSPTVTSTVSYGSAVTAAWRNITSGLNASPPLTDYGQSMMAFDPLDNYTVLFGGIGSNGLPMNDTWVFEAGGWVELHPVLSPPARSAASMAWDPRDGYLVLFGGDTSCCVVNDTWSFVHGAWTEVSGGNATPVAVGPRVTAAPTPPARDGAALAWDASDGYLLLFGGSILSTPTFNDTWRFSNGSWAEVETRLSPEIRTFASMVDDPELPGVILFGGEGRSAVLYADTWSWSGGTWSDLNVTGYASGRVFVGAAYLPTIGGVVAYGGLTAGRVFQSDTWWFRGGVWTNESRLVESSAGPRAIHALAQGANCDCLLMFGGTNGTGISIGTWEYYTLNLSVTLSPSVGEAPQNVSLIVGSSNDASFAAQWQFGDGTSGTGYSVTHVYTTSGNRTVLVNATDGAGASTDATIPVTVYPTLSLIAAATPLEGTAPLSVSGISGAVGGVAPYDYLWRVDGVTASTSASTNVTFTGPGTHTIGVVVTDQLGYSANRTFAVVVLTPTPAVGLELALNASPSVIVYNANVSLSAAVTGGTPPYTFNWTTLPRGCLSSNVSTLVCHPLSEGVLPVTVTVSDSAGASASASTTVVVASILNATMSGYATGCQTPTLALFSAAAVGGWGAYSYNWSWGDGTAGPDDSPVSDHEYQSAGTYHPSVRVSDASGQTLVAGTTIVVPNPLCVAPPSTQATGVPWWQSTTAFALFGVGIGLVIGSVAVIVIRRVRK